MKKIFAGAAIAASLVVAGAASAADLVIGGLFPMSGSNAEYGQIFSSGINLAVEHINADKKLSGKLTVVYEDSQGLPMQGVIGMNKLVNVSQTPFVMTGFTGVSKAVAPVATRTKTVVVNGGGVGPDLAELGDYFWNTIPLVNLEVRAIVPYLVKEKNLKRIALVYVDDPLGQSVLKELTSALKESGGELAGTFSVPVTAQQFAGIAAKVRDSKPDVVYIASYGSQEVQIVKQLRDNGVSQQLAGYSAFSIPSVQALPEARGLLYTGQQVNWDKGDDLTKRVLADYKKKYNKDPSVYVLNYYNAVVTFADLAARLEKEGKPITGANLLAERRAHPSFEFVGSSVSYTDNGTVQAPIQINEIVEGGQKVVHAEPAK
jgi:branched-chain amino acid transport system substrate-binding protein